MSPAFSAVILLGVQRFIWAPNVFKNKDACLNEAFYFSRFFTVECTLNINIALQ